MKSKKKENSVRNLINLYTVVMGVALSNSITKLIDSQTGLQSVTASSVMLFVGFVVTLLPFYHGALRHIDDAYIENTNPQIKDGALIVDFLLLLLHGMAFVVLSVLITVPNHFAWALISLLIVDVVWGIFVHFGSSSKSNIAEWKWTIINFCFVIVSAWYLIDHDIYLDIVQDPIKLSIPISIICLLRSLADYWWAKDFYFPK